MTTVLCAAGLAFKRVGLHDLAETHNLDFVRKEIIVTRSGDWAVFALSSKGRLCINNLVLMWEQEAARVAASGGNIDRQFAALSGLMYVTGPRDNFFHVQ